MGNKLFLTSKRKIKVFDVINLAFFTILSACMVYPFYNVFIVSFADYNALVKSAAYILPVSFNIDSYKTILQDVSFFRGFIVTIFITVAGTGISMFISICCAYALSKKDLPGRNAFLSLILFTMFFSGGLIPYYLTIKNVGLVNTIWVMIIPLAISSWYMIIMKNYFNTLPNSLEESAKLDGANDLRILASIIIPISKPMIATFSLFYVVDKWNEWWSALIFISDKNLRPLQIVLREILINFSTTISDQAKLAMENYDKPLFTTGVQMAAIVVTITPILVVYPLLQKYFVKGILVGSIKE